MNACIEEVFKPENIRTYNKRLRTAKYKKEELNRFTKERCQHLAEHQQKYLL